MFHPNRVLNLLLKVLFLILDLVWRRKDSELWVVGLPRGDRFDGNVRAIYEITRQCPDLLGPAKLKIILSADRDHEVPAADRIHWGSPAHFMALLRAGCILFHHNYNDVGLLALPWGRVNVRVSHGIHYKCVERASGRGSLINRLFLATRKTVPHHLVSSKLDALSAVAYFHLYLPEVIVTGAAKNDILLCSDLPPYYRRQLDQLNSQLAGRRLITYAPTWRTTGTSYPWDNDEVARLEAVLARQNAVFGIAGHQYLRDRYIPGSPHFIDLNALDIDIQVLLRRTDVLVSDYSSVWIDFLLMDRPIVLFQYDHSDYLTERGILHDTGVFAPQRVCLDFEELLRALQGPLTLEDPLLRRAFHQFEDGENTHRALAAVHALLGRG
jgi:CDP-glycerol glycerophosphotransferase